VQSENNLHHSDQEKYVGGQDDEEAVRRVDEDLIDPLSGSGMIEEQDDVGRDQGQ